MLDIQIAAEKLFSIFGLPITNGLITSWIVVILLVIFSYVLSRNIRRIPKTFQNIVEMAVEELVIMMQGVLHSRKKAEKFFPLIATIFTFVVISNWLGIFPVVGSIGF
ncbi:MAG: F0F1 ATP synthase subunit A, partial [Candidatus Pacebacteria bacterium]|nr:F0F1 ATP synthase subunit A [Candidatus Paceibacterota bacterium]